MNEYRNGAITNIAKNKIISEHYWDKGNNNIGYLNEVLPVSSFSRFPTNFEFQYAQQKHLLPSNSSSSICYNIPSLIPHRNHHLPPMTTTSLNNSNNDNKSLEKQNASSILQQQSSHVLLHRSPSGAQRKIRQKAQQQFQQQSSGGGMSSQNCVNKGTSGGGGTTESSNNKQMTYRSLINENGYHSLLGEPIVNNVSNTDLTSLSAGQLIDRMNKYFLKFFLAIFVFRLESISRPIQQQFSIFDNNTWQSMNNNNIGGCSIDKMSSSLTSTLSSPFQLDHHQQSPSSTATTFAFRKPTVQAIFQGFLNLFFLKVHPLPIPPRNYSSTNLICDLLNSSPCSSPKPLLIPPPLPPKKQSLLAKNSYRSFNNIQQQQKEQNNNKFDLSENNNFNNNSNTNSIFPPSMNQLKTTEMNFEVRKIEQEQQQNNNSFLYFSPPPPPLFCSQIISSTSSSISNSPSLTSLQNSLNFAIENPEKHSIEQLEELEQRRLVLIESLAKKANDRKQDKELLLNDLDEIKQLCNSLFNRIQNNNNNGLISRLKTFCEELEKSADLNILLNCQQKKLMEESKIERKNGNFKLIDNELNERKDWIKRLEEQINDLQAVQEYLAKREQSLDFEIINEFNNDIEALNEWFFCKEQFTKLFGEKRLLDEKLKEVEKLINSLKSICLLPNNALLKMESPEGERKSDI